MGIGTRFSATLASARTAKEMLESEDIHLIDLGNLSSGTGLLLLKTVKYRDQGLSINQIIKKIEALVPKVRNGEMVVGKKQEVLFLVIVVKEQLVYYIL